MKVQIYSSEMQNDVEKFRNKLVDFDLFLLQTIDNLVNKYIDTRKKIGIVEFRKITKVNIEEFKSVNQIYKNQMSKSFVDVEEFKDVAFSSINQVKKYMKYLTDIRYKDYVTIIEGLEGLKNG